MSQTNKRTACQHEAYQCFNGGETICKDCGAVFTSPQALRATRRQPWQEFNENDCSGAFDGNTVSSDADPGL